MDIKSMRLKMGLTQKQCAEKFGIPLRTYIRYEKSPKIDSFKCKQLVKLMQEMSSVDEQHGVLTVDAIKGQVKAVFDRFNVDYAYLFGSYAKGKATDTSDVDILVATKISGLKYFELIEELRQTLCKKIDLLDLAQMNNNLDLINEILKDGVKIYG